MSSNPCNYIDYGLDTIKLQSWAACGRLAARSKSHVRVA